MVLEDVEFIVLTPDRLPDGRGWVLMALRPEEYEDLGLNIAEMIRWMTEAADQLNYYGDQ